MAAARNYYWPPDFDQAATYKVAAWPAGFTVRGHQPKRGEIFDKKSVPANMLRAHYEARWLVMVDPAELPAVTASSEVTQVSEVTPATPAPAGRSEDQTQSESKLPKRSRAGGKVV